MGPGERIPAIYLLFSLDTTPVSRCVHPAKSFPQRLKLQPAPGRTRGRTRAKSALQGGHCLPRPLSASPQQCGSREDTHVNGQLVAPGRPSDYLANIQERPSFFWQSTTNHRPQKRDHHLWGVGKGSEKVFTPGFLGGGGVLRGTSRMHHTHLRPSHGG